MRKLILTNFQSPGDIVVLTAAVRDLHLSHPGRFITDVRTPCPDLWLHNPYISHVDDSDPQALTIHCEYPLIHQSNTVPYHMLHGFRMHLEERLGIPIRAHAFKGDIHLSEMERRTGFPHPEIDLCHSRFWIIVSGGKNDFTAKWWDPDRAQQVVNHFKDQITFVQCGEGGHVHPRLKHVIDLVGQTSLRQLVHLVSHADGIVCPVTLMMHLAAAVETRHGRPKNRPCVVIAGGREPTHWEAYPHHQYLHTLGALPCCDNGGCWKSRVVKLNDGDSKDESLCLFPVHRPERQPIPRCLDLITSEHVIDAIELYRRYAQ